MRPSITWSCSCSGPGRYQGRARPLKTWSSLVRSLRTSSLSPVRSRTWSSPPSLDALMLRTRTISRTSSPTEDAVLAHLVALALLGCGPRSHGRAHAPDRDDIKDELAH